MSISPEIIKYIINPDFEKAKHFDFEPLLQLHRAYALMIVKTSILEEMLGARIIEALDKIEKSGTKELELKEESEDLFFAVEKRLTELVGDASSNLHLGRSRNDISATISRMTLRDGLLRVFQALLNLLRAVLDLAEEHLSTIMRGYTHGQEAQPTTLAHYLGALSFGLARDFSRLKEVYLRLNKSPLGAGAFTTSGFPIDRQYLAELLGFEGIIENSYDCIALSPADSKAELLAALSISALTVGRFVQDLNLWSLIQPEGIHLDSSFIQISSIMPQKKNPAVLEFLRGDVAKILGNLSEVFSLIHNTQLQDVADVDHLAVVPSRSGLDTLLRLYVVVSAVVKGLAVNPTALAAPLNNNLLTATELADELVRQGLMDFRAAHRVVAWIAQKNISTAEISGEMVEEAAAKMLGIEISVPDTVVRQALSPEYFIKVRMVTGGPAPKEMSRQVRHSRDLLTSSVEWLDSKKTYVAESKRRLKQETDKLSTLQA